MSDEHHQHGSGIQTPKQLIAAVIAAFLVPIICIVLLVQYVTSGTNPEAGSQAQSSEAIAARIKPVADEGYTLKDVNAPKQLQTGAEVFKSVCFACHASGVAGAPKAGDASAWSARIAQGLDTLVAHAVHGFQGKSGMMPAKGGNPDLDDVEVARAVVYMANESGAKFQEPEAKAAAPEAAAIPAAEPAPAAAPAAPAAAAPSTTTSATPAAPSVDAGKKLFDSTCQACHGSGIAGAPKFGNNADWAPRIKQGIATLDQHAINGFKGKTGIMPPKGGSTASDDEVKAAVAYMVAAAK